MLRHRSRDIRILLDGGVEAETIAELAHLGADDFVAGGAIFYNRPDRNRSHTAAERVKALRERMP